MTRFNLNRVTKTVKEVGQALTKVGKGFVTLAKDRNFQTGVAVGFLPMLFYIRKWEKQEKEKDKLYKEALAKHNAIIKELNTTAKIDKEKQDRLLADDAKLKIEMNSLQSEIQRLRNQIAELERKMANSDET